jgi:starch synthase (maltosyl-transferring)
MIQRLNQVRRENPALQRLENLRFLETDNERLISYAKRDGTNVVLCIVNVDVAWAQEGACHVPYDLGVPPAFVVTDLLTGDRFDWHVGRNYVRLDPAERAAHVLRVETP